MAATTYYAQTRPGVEEIAWLEIRQRLPSARFVETLFAKEQNGIAVFTYDGSPDDLLRLRTAEDLFMLALSVPKLSRGRRDLAQISKWVAQGEAFGRAVNDYLRYRQFSQPPTYRVISRKYGKHEYRRKDMETAVYQGLAQRYRNWTPVADGGQVEVWANLLGSRLLIGLRLTDKRMRHRYPRKVELEAALRPSVAAAMVLLTEPAAGEWFIDPMCGSGTLLLERDYLEQAHLLGGELDAERARVAARNLSRLRRKRPSVPICRWDAQRLPLGDATVDKVAANLPFGKQIGSPAQLKALYPAFFAELARVLRPGGRAVVLSSEYDLVKDSVRQQPRLHIQTGYSIAVLGKWGRIYIVVRQ